MRWNAEHIQLETAALLKRVSIDVEGAARGYLVVGDAAYYAGTAPHLTRYTNQRAARTHALTLSQSVILTLPEEVRCKSIRLYHQQIGESPYRVRDFRPHLINALGGD